MAKIRDEVWDGLDEHDAEAKEPESAIGFLLGAQQRYIESLDKALDLLRHKLIPISNQDPRDEPAELSKHVEAEPASSSKVAGTLRGFNEHMRQLENRMRAMIEDLEV